MLPILKPFVKAFYKTKAFTIKNAPELMVGAGVTTGVIAAVIACKQTLKLDSVAEQYNYDSERIHKAFDEKTYGDEYTERDMKHDLTAIAVHRVFETAKIYALPVGLGIVSIGLVLGGFGVLKMRHAALISAYGALQTSFNEYRARVKEKYGEEEEYKLYNGIEDVTVTTTDENGETKTEVQQVCTASNTSPYVRFFDEYSAYWQRDAEYNKAFLRFAEKELNQKLQSRGYVFLNEAYSRLGLQTDKTGAVCGWIYAPDDPNHKGDNYISFGIYDGEESTRTFINGLNQSVMLNFNVDGYIMDKI